MTGKDSVECGVLSFFLVQIIPVRLVQRVYPSPGIFVNVCLWFCVSLRSMWLVPKLNNLERCHANYVIDYVMQSLN